MASSLDVLASSPLESILLNPWGRRQKSVVLAFPWLRPRLDLGLHKVQFFFRIERTRVGELTRGENAAINSGFGLVLDSVGTSGRIIAGASSRFRIGVPICGATSVTGAGNDDWQQKNAVNTRKISHLSFSL